MALWNGFALFQALRWAILSYRPALVDDAHGQNKTNGARFTMYIKTPGKYIMKTI